MAFARGLATHPDADAPARRVRRRARGVGDGRGAAGRGAQRRQGRARRAEPPARLHRRPRARAAREQRRPRDARRDDGCGRRVAARLPALPAREGAAARPRRRAAVVGPLRARGPRRRDSRGRARPTACATRSPATRPISPRSRTARSPSSGSTPRLATASRAARTAPASRATSAAIMMNFDGSQDSISTLAHELGHAFHNVALAAAHAVAAPAPDGARGDGVDLLRDVALRARGRGRGRRRRAARAARHASRRRDPDRRRHPQPVPVRDGALRAPPAHDPVGGRPEGGDARRAGGGVRRRARTRTTATSTCGR